MRKELLCIRHLTIQKKEEVFVNNLNFTIYSNEIVGLIAREDKGARELREYILEQKDILVYMIEQTSHLITALSIAENVFVMRKNFRKYFIDIKVLEDQLLRYCKEYEIDLDIYKNVVELTEYERCILELIKADILGAKLIILDNPSNYISQKELLKFHDVLYAFKKRGKSFLYIGYHHQEVFAIADRTALFTNGYIKKIFLKLEMTEERILPYILPILSRNTLENSSVEEGILRFENVYSHVLKGLSFSIRRGECVTLLDLDNNIKKDIVDLLIHKVLPISGNILWEKCLHLGKKKPMDVGIILVPEDAIKNFLFYDRSYLSNLVFLLDRKLGCSLLSRRILESVRKEYRHKVGKAIDVEQLEELETIDLIRLVYYKIYLYRPKLVICIQPYASGDVHCRMEITRLIKELQKLGTAILMISTNLADTMDVSNRLLFIESGVCKKKMNLSKP